MNLNYYQFKLIIKQNPRFQAPHPETHQLTLTLKIKLYPQCWYRYFGTDTLRSLHYLPWLRPRLSLSRLQSEQCQTSQRRV